MPALSTTRPTPEDHRRPIRMSRDLLTLDRQQTLWRIHSRDEELNEELGVETAPTALLKEIWKLLAVCLVMSALMATAIYFLTEMHAKPYNYQSVVENKHAMQVLWAFVIILAFVNSVVNGITVPRLHFIVTQYRRTCRFAGPWIRFMFACEVVSMFCVTVAFFTYVGILATWAVGPLAR